MSDFAQSTETTNQNGHGGARPGAGRKRKPISPTEHTKHEVSLPSATTTVEKSTKQQVQSSSPESQKRSAKKERSSRLRKPCKLNSTASSLPLLCANAAGIDIGAKSIYVAVPEDRAQPNVRSFETFTEDLYAIADWLSECKIETVAMEATGVYWIPLFQILEKRKFQVTLTNARNAKNVPGRKTDVKDSRWIQFLHSVGLLQGSFRPADEICAIRSYMRHRDKLVQTASKHILRMQKALTQMNIQFHNVISHLVGVSGLAVLDSIIAGNRNPEYLADLCHPSIKADKETIRKSLVGDWREEHLFVLEQELRTYRYFQTLIEECDKTIEKIMVESEAAKVYPAIEEETDENIRDAKKAKKQKKERKNASSRTKREKLLTEMLSKIFGTDLTLIPGMGVENIFRLYTEFGCNLKTFLTAAHFCSYLGLCPDNRISGGKVLSVKTRHVPSRAATIFRIAANCLASSKSPLGDYLRRMKARLGKQEGITAVAHKLARIFYHLVTTGETYDETKFELSDRQLKRRKDYIIREATKLGFTLTPNSVLQ